MCENLIGDTHKEYLLEDLSELIEISERSEFHKKFAYGVFLSKRYDNALTVPEHLTPEIHYIADSSFANGEFLEKLRELHSIISNLETTPVCVYCEEKQPKCQCKLCDECDEPLDECECDRCEVCELLIDDCNCERCTECKELTEDCDCEAEAEADK